jgi:hypothetical protein
MQSFIQYHKFRQHVEQQHARHIRAREKAETATRDGIAEDNTNILGRQSSALSIIPQSEQPDSRDSVDLEKGDSSGDTLPGNAAQGMGELPERGRENEGKEEDEKIKDELRAPGLLPGDNHLSRTSTTATHISEGTALGVSLTGINVRDRTTNEAKGGVQVFVVGYEGDGDPLNPHNWSYTTRAMATMMIAGIGFVVGVASSIDSSAIREAAVEFGVSEVTESLATGMWAFIF